MTPNDVASGSRISEEALGRLVERLTARLQAGEAVDEEAILREYPEHADALRRLLPTLRVLGELGSCCDPARAGEDAGRGGDSLAGVLGDFRIVREVGRGGMGVVYEAEQVSLGRRVALKVLPFAATMDPRHLQRFHNEARAAACLHHTNIVPVFFVGCERGVHFYAMQFIDGRPLSDVIREMGQPPTVPAPSGPAPGEQTGAYTPPDRAAVTTEPAARLSTVRTAGAARGRDYFRKVAELGEQAAGALAHAHQAGIVHRDVKPGNLLLDAQGKLWVTDFGLAHCQSTASLTLTGDLVGTLRYMSPEQALAKRVVIDHRTDVYSLGATLYELLTLEPVFAGSDRQELLRQIAFEEPKPPRRIDKTIPAELETIVLKALEKNPAERYTMAQDLADDLRNFLEDMPIRAQRPSLRRVAAKWARRHKTVVWAAAAVLLVAAVLAGGFGVWRLQQRAAAEAEAEAVVKEVGRLQAEEKWPEALFTIRRAEPLLNTGLLGEGLRQRVRERLDDLNMVDRLEQIRLEQYRWKWGTSPTKRGTSASHLYRPQADPAYARAFRDFGIDVAVLSAEEAAGRIRARDIRVELAAALDDWAWVCQVYREEGDMTWRELLALARAADPDEVRNRLRDAWERNDAEALKGLAAPGMAGKLPPSTLVLLGKSLAKLGAYEQAVTVLEEGQRRHPGNFWVNFGLAEDLHHLGPTHLEDAVRYYTVAVALRPQNPVAHSAFGIALSEKGRVDEAIAEFEKAISLKNDDPAFHTNLGNALDEKGRVDEAIAAYREAIRVQKDFEPAHANLGVALGRKGLWDEAVGEYQEAIRINKESAEAHTLFGNALQTKGRLGEAIAEFREALRLQENSASAHKNLATALQLNGQLDEAIAAYKVAIRLRKEDAMAHFNLGLAYADQSLVDEAIAEYREATRLKPDYAEAHCILGRALMYKGRFEEALNETRRGHELGSPNRGWTIPSARWVRDCEYLVDLVDRLPEILSGEKRPADARDRLELAGIYQRFKKRYVASARFYDEAFADRPKLADDLSLKARYKAARAAALAGCGQGEDAARLGDPERARLRGQALAWLRADLALLTKIVTGSRPEARAGAGRFLQQWLEDSDFAGVRGEALAKLPEAERQLWRTVWADVAETLARARAPAAAAKKLDMK
jgi:tetratricopeptide (TPR) repeat protein